MLLFCLIIGKTLHPKSPGRSTAHHEGTTWRCVAITSMSRGVSVLGNIHYNMSDVQKLDKIIEKLREEDRLIIVEGKKDLRSLDQLGITNCRSVRGPLYAFAEEVARTHSKVILLLDADKAGEKLTRKLKCEFAKLGVSCDLRMRAQLRSLKLSQIEGIKNRLRNLKKKKR